MILDSLKLGSDVLFLVRQPNSPIRLIWILTFFINKPISLGHCASLNLVHGDSLLSFFALSLYNYKPDWEFEKVLLLSANWIQNELTTNDQNRKMLIWDRIAYGGKHFGARLNLTQNWPSCVVKSQLTSIFPSVYGVIRPPRINAWRSCWFVVIVVHRCSIKHIPVAWVITDL